MKLHLLFFFFFDLLLSLLLHCLMYPYNATDFVNAGTSSNENNIVV